MDSRDQAEQFHPESVAAWRQWLEANHAQSPGVWVVSWRGATGRRAVAYDDLVLEALAFGWVDGQARPLDDDRSMLWFTQRKPGSGWARTNKERIAQLEREGRMSPAGEHAVELARENGSWTLLDDAENLTESAELSAALDAVPAARANWDAFPASVRKFAISWVAFAKKPETRARRIADIVDKASRGERPS
ncbi:MAG: YdeI/OmpD-associated family protein [Microbacteriaceae bacterium]